MRWIFVLIISLLVSESHAKSVDLSNQFLKEIPKQEYGNYACHVYATTALIEAACFRKTRNHMDLSESLLLYGHYVHDIERKTATDIDESLSVNQSHPPLLPNEFPLLLGAERDGGYTYSSLATATSGWLCPENQFIGWEKFKSIVGMWKWYQNVYGKFLWARSIDGIILDEFKLAKDMAETGAWIQNTPQLSECLKSIEIRSEIFSESRAIQLLDEGIPFVCSAGAEFYEFKGGKNRQIVFSADQLGHSTIILGYSQDSAGVQWKVRDSSVGEMVPARGKCNRIYFIR